MRIVFLAFFAFAVLAACERETVEAPAPAAPVPEFEATISDELPVLGASVTGIAFWDHPALPFNGMMIVASADGVVSYNIEDGNEVSRIPGVNAQGAAVSYLGIGPQAAGVVATLDADENAFKFYGVANTSRTFLPIDGGPAIRGNVRGFCFGRAIDGNAPSLFVVQKSRLSIFNFEEAPGGLSLVSETELETPDNIARCAVDIDGVVLGADDKGAIYRIAGNDSFAAPLAAADFSGAGEMAVIALETLEGDDRSLSGQIALLDKTNGALHIFDRANGQTLGVITMKGTDELEGVSAANGMGATAGNLGGLYRNGAFAFAVDAADGPAVRILPISGVLNALSLPGGDAISPRGKIREVEDNDLLIDIEFNPQ